MIRNFIMDGHGVNNRPLLYCVYANIKQFQCTSHIDPVADGLRRAQTHLINHLFIQTLWVY